MPTQNQLVIYFQLIRNTLFQDFKGNIHGKKKKEEVLELWRDINAWIDCVDELSNEPTLIEIHKGKLLKQNVPEILEAIFECSAFVNFRKVEIGQQPTLMVSMS